MTTIGYSDDQLKEMRLKISAGLQAPRHGGRFQMAGKSSSPIRRRKPKTTHVCRPAKPTPKRKK